MKGLAKFMTAGPSAQRTVVRNFKYPKEPEPRAQKSYYRDATKAIRQFRREKLPVQWLSDRAQLLLTNANSASKANASRMRENARAIQQYAVNFAGHDAEVLTDIDLPWNVGDVRIKVRPDLHYRERDREKIMRFELGSKTPSTSMLRILCQAMFEAATANSLSVKCSDCSVLDVPRGAVHKLARVRARTVKDIEAACKTISDIWPRI
jgi:hypothetical protein